MTDWITGLMADGGYLAVAALMLLENLFPPIPSELVMPLAGYTAQRGELDIVLVVLSGAAGSLAGALFWYAIGRWVGAARLKRFAGRHGRWLTLSPEEIDRADAWFDRHGGMAVLIGRLIPAVRTLISVPAGIAGMGLGRFLLYTSAGTLAWTALLAAAGWLLGDNYDAVSDYIDPVSKLIVGGIVVWYLYRVATFGRTHRRSEQE
jgi:membrane protein DedA with SNARE-associated domain